MIYFNGADLWNSQPVILEWYHPVVEELGDPHFYLHLNSKGRLGDISSQTNKKCLNREKKIKNNFNLNNK